MKKNILWLLTLISFSAMAGVEREVKIEIVSETLAQCKLTSEAMFLNNDVEGTLMANKLYIADITACNKTMTGKYKKVIRFYKSAR